jgi:hypothetical protein
MSEIGMFRQPETIASQSAARITSCLPTIHPKQQQDQLKEKAPLGWL